jgi:hypothetical protein
MKKLAGNNTLAYFSLPSVSKEKKLIKFSLDSVQSPVIPALMIENLKVVWAEFSTLSGERDI